MTRIHELLQTAGAAIRILNGKRKNAIVAPVSRPGELCDGHDLDRGYSHVYQFVQAGNDSFESRLRLECADVQFINNVIFDRQAEPMSVLPIERWVDDLGRAVNPLRLVAGPRIRVVLVPSGSLFVFRS